MRKKLILFLMLALFGSANFLRADVVEIGDGTSTSYVSPYNSLWGYSYVEQIYTASEIGMAGTINSISFNLRDTDAAQTNQIDVFMKAVSRDSFSGTTDFETVTAADMVYSGTFTFNPGWSEIILDTPFDYDGTSNLLIGVHEYTSGYSTRYFYYTSATDKVLTFHSDGANPDPYNLGSYTGNSYVSPNRSNIKIDITAGGGGGTAATVTIGDGTSTYYYYPVNMYFNYSLTEQIYMADEIGTGAATINSISFYYDYTSSFSMNNVTLYMKNVTRDAFASTTDMEPLALGDVVWTGTLSATEAGWITIDLDTPFAYDGTNLLVAGFDGTSGYPGSSFKFRTTECTGYKGIHWYSDSYCPDPYNTTSYSGSKSYTQYRNNIQLGVTIPQAAWAPDYNAAMGDIVLVNPEIGQQNVPDPLTLRWTNAENAQYYYVEFGTVYGNLDLLVYGEEVEGWNGSLKLSDYDITIEPNTRYYWRVYNENNVDWVESELGVFTGVFNKPNNVKVIPDEIFSDGSTLVKWNIVDGNISELPETVIGSGTNTSPYLPTYNLYDHSLTEQIFTVEEIGNAGIINSITFRPQSSITRNLDVYMVNTDKTSFASGSDWVAVTADDLVFSGSVAMASPTTTITLDSPFTFDGTNLLLVVNDLTGEWTSSIQYATFDATSQAIYVYRDNTPYDPTAPSSYSGYVATFKNQIIINNGRTANRDLVGCNVYVDSVLMNTDGPITERQYNLTGAHMAELGVLPYNIDGHSVCVTGVFDYGESNFSDPAILYVSGYGDVHGVVKDLMTNTGMADVNVSFSGKDEFDNTVSYQATTLANGTYTIANVKAGTYDVTATYEGCDPAVIEGVVLAYGVDNEVDILYLHENYNPVFKVYAEEGEVLGATVADVIWSFGDFDDPTPGNGGGNGGGGGGGTAPNTFTEDFEGGLNGWTVLKVNSEGGEWIHSSNNLGGYDYTTLAHGGSGFAMCYSFVDYVGSFNTDSYLVTPQKYSIVAGSTLNFWADNANDSYPENFSVCVATAANPSAADFTQVWSGGAKGQGGSDVNRHIANRYQNWRSHSIDLSAYAGQQVWIAFHDVNYDAYEIWIDDVELTTGTKNAPVVYTEEDYIKMNSLAPQTEQNNVNPMPVIPGLTRGNTAYACNAYGGSNPTGWISYDIDNPTAGTSLNSGVSVFGGDLAADGYVYATYNDNNWYKIDPLTGNVEASGSLGMFFVDCAYDYTTDVMYGSYSGSLYIWDLATNTTSVVGTMGGVQSMQMIACDLDGQLYGIEYSTGNFDAIDKTTGAVTVIGPTGYSPAYVQGGGFDHNTGKLYWAGYTSTGIFCEIDKTTGAATLLGNNVGEQLSWCVPYTYTPGGATGGSNLATNDYYFQIWRRPMLKENMPTDPAEIEALAIQIDESDHSLGFNDSVYTDLSYMNLEPGIYEYGIAAVYPWVDRSDFNVTGTVWSNDLEHNMTTAMTINGTCALGVDQIAGAVVTLVNNNEDYTYEAELDEEGVWSNEEFRRGDYTMTVNLPGYLALVANGADVDTVPADGLVMNLWAAEEINIEFVEDYAPVTWFTVSSTGFARWSDMLPQDRVAQRYHVLCDEIFQGETENNYMFLNTDNLVEGETYTAAVAVVYETGMSDFVTADFTYMPCENVGTQVEDLEGTVDLADVTLTWAGGNGSGIVPPPPGGATTFTEGFESGMPDGWTVVDGNNDGWTWCLTSAIPSTWTYYASLTLDWYRTGTNAICSGSYINGVGALTPNEYLVTDQVNLAAGSTFSFWAAATDASYPADHFGVFVSDDATTWTSVQEWTLTGKKGGNDGGRASRDGNGAKLGTWYNYSVDLSAYAGQKYIAIRHFNCNDQYIMCVDDIELSAGSKDGFVLGTAGHGFGLANNSLSDDGNWYYYDNGVNEDAIGTGGGNFWWGIMLPAGTYEGNSLTKVAAYDYMAMTGTASIYQGGTTAPAGAALGTVNVTFTGSSDFVEFTFAEPVTIDPSQNVWVVFYNGSAATYPAAVCSNTGDANGRWVSLDGSTWADLASYGLDYTFMVRAYIEQSGVTPPPTPGATAITPNAYNIFMDGELIGATTDTTFTYTCNDDLEHQYCVMFFDADYNVSCANCINITADPLGVGQYNVVSAIYPNPTNGNLYINTNANMKRISIVNVLGQMVYNKATEGTETVIDMAQFGNGIYMVSIVTENGTSVNRIIVNK